MRFPLYIAKRYFFARKSHNIINVISGISFMGVTIGTMALVIVLSVFNGFESLVTSLFNSFNPDFQVTATVGKSFSLPADKLEELRQLPGVVSLSPVYEEKALLRYRDKQMIVTLKGVDADYGSLSGLDTMTTDGRFFLEDGPVVHIVMGYGIAFQVDAYLEDIGNPVGLYLPRPGLKVGLLPTEAFNSVNAMVSGVFSVQQEFDSKYVFIAISEMRRLTSATKSFTSLEIRTLKTVKPSLLQSRLASLLPKEYTIKNRFEQEELLFKVMRSEKWAIFLILTFILFIATFNIIGTLTMLILEKKRDIAVLFSLGANEKTIRHIFLIEGWMISLAGAITGLVLGLLVCLLQQEFGLVSLGGDSGSFLVQSYPVKIKAMDFLYVFATVLSIGLLAAWVPARRITQQYLDKRALSV